VFKEDRTFNFKDVATFLGVTGDTNKLHTDKAAAIAAGEGISVEIHKATLAADSSSARAFPCMPGPHHFPICTRFALNIRDVQAWKMRYCQACYVPHCSQP